MYLPIMEKAVLLFLLFIETAISLEKEPPLPKPIDLIKKHLKDDIESQFGPLESDDDSKEIERTNRPTEVVKQNTPVMTTIKKRQYNTASDTLIVENNVENNNRTDRKHQNQNKSNTFDNMSNEQPQNSSMFSDRAEDTEQEKFNLELSSKEDFIDKLNLDIDDTRKFFRKDTAKKSSEFKDKETQLEWAHCQDIITPFIKGLKQNISKPKHVDSNGHVIRRFIHLITLDTEEYTDQVQSVLLQINNLQLRMFQWTAPAITTVLDALAMGKQTIHGIELNKQYEKILNELITGSTLLIPSLKPSKYYNGICVTNAKAAHKKNAFDRIMADSCLHASMVKDKVHDFKHLKLGVQKLFLMWNLNINNTMNILKQTRIFRPPCIRKPGTLSTKSHKGHNYKYFKQTLSPRPTVIMPKHSCRGDECSTPAEDTVY